MRAALSSLTSLLSALLPALSSFTQLYYTNRLKKLAAQYKGKVAITYSDKTNQKVQVEHLNLQDEEHGFVIDNLAGQLYRYDPDEDAQEEVQTDAQKKAAKGKKKALDLEGWGHFLEDYLAGDATPYARSQRAPRNNAALPVKMATGQNFDELVNQPDKDVMIEFYAPWCGHCNALSPKYEQLGEKLLKEKGVVIAKLDATANDFDRKVWEVKGYPSQLTNSALPMLQLGCVCGRADRHGAGRALSDGYWFMS